KCADLCAGACVDQLHGEGKLLQSATQHERQEIMPSEPPASAGGVKPHTHMGHFSDRLTDAIRSKGTALCVGFDPRWESLPDEIRARHGDGTLAGVARAYDEFCFRVLDIVAPLVAVVKPQSAFFEACGPDGLAVLQRLLRAAKERRLITILDSKRNDIA